MNEWPTSALLLVLGAVLGAVSTYLATYYLEKRKWEVQAAILRKDNVYAPVYAELSLMANTLASFKQSVRGSLRPRFQEWQKVRDKADVFLVPAPLVARLDSFLAICSSYGEAHSALFPKVRSLFNERHADQDDYGVALLLGDKMLVADAESDHIILEYFQNQGRSLEQLEAFWMPDRLLDTRNLILGLPEWKSLTQAHSAYVQGLADLKEDLAGRIRRIIARYQKPRSRL
jgi:hypothetical protein